MTFAQPKAIVAEVESRPGCMQAALSILGDKWSPLLIGQLVEGPKTFSNLETMLAGISPRTLSARLEKLVDCGIIDKIMYCERPPRYNYELTSKGAELGEILSAMSKWGDRHHKIN